MNIACVSMIAPLQYREEDRFREETNARKLKELYQQKDYTALLEFALLLNHEVSSKNSALSWVMKDALEIHRPVKGDRSEENYMKLVSETLESMIAKRNENISE